MLTKLLTTSDGKIPFLQILIGMIVGAIGMFVYAKFWKPKILYDNVSLKQPDLLESSPVQSKKRQKVTNNERNTEDDYSGQQQPQQSQSVQRSHISHTQQDVPMPQAYIEVQQIPMPQMPTIPALAAVYESEEYSDDSDEHPEDDEQDDDDGQEVTYQT